MPTQPIFVVAAGFGDHVPQRLEEGNGEDKRQTDLFRCMGVRLKIPWRGEVKAVAALIKNLDIIITPDTSISHIASAFDKPVVTIHENNQDSFQLFAPTSPLSKTVFSTEKNSLAGYDVQKVIELSNQLINKI